MIKMEDRNWFLVVGSNSSDGVLRVWPRGQSHSRMRLQFILALCRLPETVDACILRVFILFGLVRKRSDERNGLVALRITVVDSGLK